jgi:hypothetical protein
MLRKTGSGLLDLATRSYLLAAFLAATLFIEVFRAGILYREPVAFDLTGDSMIERTAETRFELMPKNSPISSGVGTELRIMCTPIAHDYTRFSMPKIPLSRSLPRYLKEN